MNQKTRAVKRRVHSGWGPQTIHHPAIGRHSLFRAAIDLDCPFTLITASAETSSKDPDTHSQHESVVQTAEGLPLALRWGLGTNYPQRNPDSVRSNLLAHSMTPEKHSLDFPPSIGFRDSVQF